MRFAQQYSSEFDHAPYSYWYDTPLARDQVPHVRVKETMADQASFSVEAMVRGYHAYKDIWTAINGKELPGQREDGNRVDAFAVAIMKDGTVVGHVLKKISSVCSLYLR